MAEGRSHASAPAQSQPSSQNPKVRKIAYDEKRAAMESKLFVSVEEWQWPIIYHPEYNISFLGMEKLHPFDAGKWGNIFNFLKDDGMIRDDTTIRPNEAQHDDLMVAHTSSYINSLKWSWTVAGITEVPPVALLPNFIVQRRVLKPFRLQTGGTILAASLAVQRGWALNIGGGFHHCSGDRGGGFCAYADITLAIKFLFHRNANIRRVMIVDLDAHQGNGHERDFLDDKPSNKKDKSVYIMDVYNRGIYPRDGFAKRGISRRVELQHFTEDAEYLALVDQHLGGALREYPHPDLIVYNAGTDILKDDPLGALSITPDGIIRRDELVFEWARKKNDIPVLMVTSGGYQRVTARIIANSVLNLRQKGLIGCQLAEDRPPPATAATSPPSAAGVSQDEKGRLLRSTSMDGLSIWSKFRTNQSQPNITIPTSDPTKTLQTSTSSTTPNKVETEDSPSKEISQTLSIPKSKSEYNISDEMLTSDTSISESGLSMSSGSSSGGSRTFPRGTYFTNMFNRLSEKFQVRRDNQSEVEMQDADSWKSDDGIQKSTKHAFKGDYKRIGSRQEVGPQVKKQRHVLDKIYSISSSDEDDEVVAGSSDLEGAGCEVDEGVSVEYSESDPHPLVPEVEEGVCLHPANVGNDEELTCEQQNEADKILEIFAKKTVLHNH